MTIISICEWNEERIELLSLGDFQWEIIEVEEFQNNLIKKVQFSKYELSMIARYGFDHLNNMLGMDFTNEINGLIECYGKEEFLKFAKKLN